MFCQLGQNEWRQPVQLDKIGPRTITLVLLGVWRVQIPWLLSMVAQISVATLIIWGNHRGGFPWITKFIQILYLKCIVWCCWKWKACIKEKKICNLCINITLTLLSSVILPTIFFFLATSEYTYKSYLSLEKRRRKKSALRIWIWSPIWT